MNLRRHAAALLIAGAAASAVVVGGAGTALAAPATPDASQTVTTAAAPAQAPASVPISGTFTDATGALGTVTGTFTPTRFVNQGGQLAATGTLAATLTDAAGNVLGTTSQTVTTPAAVSTATCQVLTLNLGPLHLNLLGLVVDLAPVNLNITAQQAPGNLLGNLLCAVTHLLDANGPLSGLTALLNQILGAL